MVTTGTPEQVETSVRASGRFAEVAVNGTYPHRQTFSYSVPADMDVRPGHAVYVPFGRQVLQAIVLETHDTPVFSRPEKIRSVRGFVTDAPLLDAERVELALWLAHRYLAAPFDAAAVLLPPGFERRPLTVLHPLLAREEVPALDVPERQRALLAALTDGGPTDMEALRQRVHAASLERTAAHLERRGLIARSYALARPSVGPRSEDIATLADAPAAALAAIERAEPPKASRRAAVLRRLLERASITNEEGARLAGSRANLERLVRGGIIRRDRDAHNLLLAMSREEALGEIAHLTRSARATQGQTGVRLLAEHQRTLAELRAAGVETPTARWLAEIGAVRITSRTVERNPLGDGPPPERCEPPPLLAAQAVAADAISRAVESREHRVFLLHGVTGSGKTEVYLEALDRTLGCGRRAIVLVPEIALTPQTVRRFRARFERVAVLHSGLTPGELFDQWHGIAAGRYDVVIGPRSAVFAPQPDVGLIVVDEEHEWTYKQHDPMPRYHARDVAIELARLKQGVVVLGSATPDVATYDRATRGAYTLLTLPERVRPVVGADGHARPQTVAALPQVTVIDLREELKAGNRSMFSGALRAALESTLAADEQAILFLNKRGLAGHVQCRDCGYVPECPSCSVALTFHSQYDRLVCHQCNRQARLPVVCRHCGSPRIRLLGGGVEKVEAETRRAFPHARLLRWDRDVTKGRRAHEEILAAFLAHEADILIGTQMLAKGLDLPAVTLVGVVNADVALHLPDFRTGERTFQLLTQVAGRAGRGERPGRVIIQTYTPDHYAIEAAARYDYDAFVETELQSRGAHRYPPFGRLVRLTVSHANPRRAREDALRLHRALSLRRAESGSDDAVLGPSPAYVPRVRGRWRWQITLHGDDPASLVRGFLLPDDVAVDVDPVG